MSWSLVKLGELVTIKGGGTPSKKVKEYWNGNIPWASVKDLKSNEISKTVDAITELGVNNSATNIIPAGTILTATRMALGKFAINTIDMAINQDLKALFVNDETKVDRDFLIRFLESKAQFIDSEGKGATVKGITLDFLKNLEIPLPPLDEQKRIAAILDKADAIRRKRKNAINLADDFLRSVFLDMFGDPVSNSKNLELQDFGTIADFINGDRSSNYPSGDDIIDNGILFLNTKNIVKNKLVFKEKAFISQQKFDSLSRGKLQKRDLVITLRGTLGSCAIFDNKFDTGFINAQIMILRCKKDIYPEYLHALLTSKSFHSMLQKIGNGAAVPQLTATQLKVLKIPVPPVALQEKFIELLNLFRNMTMKLDVNQTPLLFDSLSQKAFAGQL